MTAGYLRRLRKIVADPSRCWQPENWEHGLQATQIQAESYDTGEGDFMQYDPTMKDSAAGRLLLRAAGAPSPTSTFQGSRMEALALIDRAIRLS